MNQKQRALFSQLQLCGLGIVLIVFGWIMDLPPAMYTGAGLLVYGVIRFMLLKKMTHNHPDDLQL